ncbi:tyrosinase family oxidase copper chaperone, partial [Streptomyces olivochromogenes]|uniref:tyrosinase family oxidase copper chaperone n=1 Tax=Streptomyces olivochromogenes TaxID=1963 RepID=UPI0036DAF62E
MPELTRRRALGAAAALAAAAGTQTVAVARAADTGHHGGPEAFDEVYRGRRITGRAADGGGHPHENRARVGPLIPGGVLQVVQEAEGSGVRV